MGAGFVQTQQVTDAAWFPLKPQSSPVQIVEIQARHETLRIPAIDGNCSRADEGAFYGVTSD